MKNNAREWILKKFIIERCLKDLKLCCPLGNDEDECNTYFFEALRKRCLKETSRLRLGCVIDYVDDNEDRITTSFFNVLEALGNYPMKETVTHISELTLTDKYVWIATKWLDDCLMEKSFFGTGLGIINILKSALNCIKFERDYLKR